MTLAVAGSITSGYQLTRSLRFRSSASAYLSRTPASASNQTTWTWSGWVKRGGVSNAYMLFAAGTTPSNDCCLFFETNDTITWFNRGGFTLVTSQVFRDPSAWYHVVVALDTTQATASNRAKIYINGSQVTALSTATYPTQNSTTAIDSNVAHYMGRRSDGNYFDGYLTEINFIDGQALTPSSFGTTDPISGVWQPAKYTGTYGTNGFYLPFTDNSALTTSSNAGLGKDFSGNTNYWVTNNISITAGSSYDSMTDVPTLTSATAANYAVMNPLDLVTLSLSNGNLTATATSSVSSQIVRATMQLPTSGKWYWEQTPTSGANCAVGITVSSVLMVGGGSTTYNNSIEYQADGNKNVNGTVTAYGASYTTNDVVGVAFDADGGTLTFYKNNSSQGSISITASNGYSPNVRCWSSTIINSNFGQRPFSYTPPTGFVALNTYNLPNSTIIKGNTVMDATTYTGNGSTLSVVNTAGFKPDLVWLKTRSTVQNHSLIDSVRGNTKILYSDLTNAENTFSGVLDSFNSNGFTLGSSASVNQNGTTFVGWQWQAGQGVTSSNTNGSITSTVSVNPNAGFSIVTYTGNSSAAATVGHSLGVAPKMIIVKNRTNGTTNWPVYHTSLTSGYMLLLSATNAQLSISSTSGSGGVPASTVNSTTFGFAQGVTDLLNVNTSANNYVAYCWAEIAGFSKFGSWSGNGSTDGPFVYTGFKPAFVMLKRTDSTSNWTIRDNKRAGYNDDNDYLCANLSDAEANGSTYPVDLLSNGFKFRTTDGNVSGGTYIFMAFAENPFRNSLAR